MMSLLLPLAGAATVFLLGGMARASPRSSSSRRRGPMPRAKAKRAAEKAHALGVRKGRKRTERKVVRAAERIARRRRRAKRVAAKAAGKPDPLGDLLPKRKPKRRSKGIDWSKIGLPTKRKRKAAPKRKRKRKPARKTVKMGRSTLRLTPDQIAKWRAEARKEMKRKRKAAPKRKRKAAPKRSRLDVAREAAAELYLYVTETNTKPRTWGHKGSPNAFIQSRQKAMGGITADGIYGPGTRRRGKDLINKTFPPRR